VPWKAAIPSKGLAYSLTGSSEQEPANPPVQQTVVPQIPTVVVPRPYGGLGPPLTCERGLPTG